MEAILDDGLPQQAKPLLRLRAELRLLEAEPDPLSSRGWLLHDPLSGRYFRLNQRQVELLGHIDAGDAQQVASAASEALSQPVTADEVERLFTFLRRQNLVDADQRQIGWFRQQRGARPGWMTRFVRGYLFVRIPLVRPDRMLARTLPWVRWLVGPATLPLLLLIAMAGLFLASRQTDQFLTTFLHFFTWQGVALYLVVLLLVKILHELGHAYVAKAHGCRVPVMGLALLVLWPVLYTDTSDAWRLASRRARLQIGVAGMAVELAIAAVALLCWSLVDDGPLRSVLFLLATATWMMTLLVNLNPLLRFDGYYLLSDWVSLPNLEQRAFAMGRWWLRERLFAPGHPPPERGRNWLVGFAWAVWCYRFLLFLGIALLVYALFFKVLGVVLFVIEIVYFILAPIGRELRAWYGMRDQFRLNWPLLRTGLLLVVGLLLLIVPWRGSVEAPALLEWPYQPVYAPSAGQLERLHVRRGVELETGTPLLTLSAPQLAHELAMLKARHAELLHLAERSGFDRRLLGDALINRSELLSQQRRIVTLERQIAQLQVTAPRSGEVVDLAPELAVGQWLAEGELLLAIRDRPARLTAYLREEDVARVAPGSRAIFHPEAGGESAIEAEVVSVDALGVALLDNRYLASTYGGTLGVRESETGELVPTSGLYRCQLRLLGDEPPPQRVLRGTVTIDGAVESLASRLHRWLVGLLVRESGS